MFLKAFCQTTSITSNLDNLVSSSIELTTFTASQAKDYIVHTYFFYSLISLPHCSVCLNLPKCRCLDTGLFNNSYIVWHDALTPPSTVCLHTITSWYNRQLIYYSWWHCGFVKLLIQLKKTCKWKINKYNSACKYVSPMLNSWKGWNKLADRKFVFFCFQITLFLRTLSPILSLLFIRKKYDFYNCFA